MDRDVVSGAYLLFASYGSTVHTFRAVWPAKVPQRCTALVLIRSCLYIPAEALATFELRDGHDSEVDCDSSNRKMHSHPQLET